MALAGAATLAFAIVGRRRDAAFALVCIGSTLGAYAVGMASLGLPLQPSSVLVKSAVAHEAVSGSLGLVTLLRGALTSLAASIKNQEAWPVLILICLSAAHPLLKVCKDSMLRGSYRLGLKHELILAPVVLAALVAHVLFGAWGWCGRYEVYAVAIGATGSLIIWSGAIADLVSRGSAALIGAFVLLLFYVGNNYVMSTLKTPVASRGIFEQHYQMHRFVVGYCKRAVGVNDLGSVSDRNPYYVLDLWSLGSEVVRKARYDNPSASNSTWIGQMVESHDIGLVMIYEVWFVGKFRLIGNVSQFSKPLIR